MAKIQVVAPRPCVITMAEGNYVGVNQSYRSGPNSREVWSIEVSGGIPVWGHGMSSGEMDGIYSITFGNDVTTSEEAVRAYAESVDRARKSYGDPKLPNAMTVAEAEVWHRETQLRDRNARLYGLPYDPETFNTGQRFDIEE